MRAIAAFFTLSMLAAAGLAGAELRAALVAPTPRAAPAEMARAATDVGAATPAAPGKILWPALFGEPEPPAPPAPPTPAPVETVEEKQPPAQPRPPLSALGYQLKGVVRAGDAVWGLVSHPTGDQIMRVGDTLADGLVIERIDEAGLWVETGDGEPALLGFAE